MTVETCLLTYSGHYLDYMRPKPEDIDIEGIAHALSNICRFNGHVSHFYSVAQHSTIMSRKAPNGLGLEALLHDAVEAYIGDAPTTLKRFFLDIRGTVDRIKSAISSKFNIPFHSSPEIKKLDRIMLATERRDLMPEQNIPWAVLEGVEPFKGRINPLSPRMAKIQFLERFEELTL